MKSIDLIIRELKKQGINAQKINKRNLSTKYGSSIKKEWLNTEQTNNKVHFY